MKETALAQNHPGGHGRGEFQRERNAKIDDGYCDQLADQAVLDAEVKDGQETADDDDIDDTHNQL